MMAESDRFLEVFLDTNNKCNLRCLTCAFSDPRVSGIPLRIMSPELFTKICEQILPRAEYAALSCLTEPLMTRNFADFVRRAGRAGVPRLEFVTNGLLLREEHLEAAVEANLWRMSVSIDGADQETYETIRRGGSFARITSRFAMAADHFARSSHRPVLRVIMTLIQENFLGAPRAVKTFIDWGATEIELRETVSVSGIGLEERQLYDRRAELTEILREAESVAESAGIPIEIQSENAPKFAIDMTAVPPCHALERRVAISPTGNVVPCMLWAREPLGNLTEQTFDEIWDAEPHRAFQEEFRRDLPIMWCPTCTACKQDPGDDDAFYRLLTTGSPGAPRPSRGGIRSAWSKVRALVSRSNGRR